MPTTLLMMFICFTFYFFVPVVSAKESCKQYLIKLHQIQALQREGHSLDQSHKLKLKEDHARKIWWNCTKQPSKLRGNKSSSPAKNNRKNKNKAKQVKSIDYSEKKLPTFNRSDAFSTVERYQGKKQLAWLKFYKQPKQCLRAKALKVFVFCVEDRLNQKKKFELHYK